MGRNTHSALGNTATLLATEIQRAGGVGAADRIEVAPVLPDEGRLSFVTSDPRAIDLACFARLTRNCETATQRARRSVH